MTKVEKTKEEDHIERLNELELHSSWLISEKMQVTRVPGGLIYGFYLVGCVTSVFIPVKFPMKEEDL